MSMVDVTEVRKAGFARFASHVARWSGNAVTFGIAVILVIVWAATGPIFNYSDSWQMIINTGTTICTFLMVFVIQNSQNRDGMALQAKLDELIRAAKDARNGFIGLEDYSEEELSRIHRHLHEFAERARRDMQEDSSASQNAIDAPQCTNLQELGAQAETSFESVAPPSARSAV